MKTILPDGREIGDGRPCFVVAEIGQNHNGDVYQAVRLMGEAAKCGVDAVKFCKRHIPSDLTREARNAPYTGRNAFGPTYGMHREALELSVDEYAHLKDRHRYNNWPFLLFATACDIQSVADLESSWSPPIYKVASRDLDNVPLLEYIGNLDKPVILSTGMGTVNDVQDAIKAIGHENVIVLLCTSEYPTPNNHVGLSRLEEIREYTGCLVGLSDHTPGIVAAQTAAALGACMVEKHFTLSRALPGTDHACSLEPKGMAKLVENIRAVEQMMNLSEEPDVSQARDKLGRSLVTRCQIDAGTVIAEHHLTLKSPGDGIRWRNRNKVIGKVARRCVPEDVTLDLSDVVEPRPAEAINGSV